MNKAIEVVLTQSYDLTRFPFSTQINNGGSIDNYVTMSQKVFKTIFQPQSNLDGKFDFVSRSEIIPGGILDQILYTG